MATSYFECAMFASEPFKTSQEQRNLDKQNVAELLNNLKEVYHIKVPDKFVNRLLEAHFCTSSAPFYMSDNTINSIFEACSKWKTYLKNPADFDSLVCNELIYMEIAHCSVLSAYFIEKAGIELVDKRPSPSYALIVSRNGDVKEIR